MNLGDVPQELMDDFGVVVKYYPGRLCSCVGANHGAFDPKCGCYAGFRYKDPMEYRVIRTQVRYDKLTEKAGLMLQGGCVLTIPKYLDKNNAQITGKKNLNNGVDLSTDYKLLIGIDGDDPVEINCRTGAADIEMVHIQTIIANINEAMGTEVAIETNNDGDIGLGYITIRSLTVGENSKVNILKPTLNDATLDILGLGEREYPYNYTWSNSGRIYLPLYHSLSVGDVFVVKNRHFRDSYICHKGVNDVIKAFDIEAVEVISKQGTIYKNGIDYTVSGNTVTWIEDGDAPEEGEHYAVEYRLPLQYVVYQDMGADRGADADQTAKKVLAAMRNYVNAQTLAIDNLGG